MAVIIEDGEQRDVTDQQAESLVRRGLIYACTDESCCGCFHIEPGVDWLAIATLGELL